MNVRHLSILLTDQCNFNCTYCYQWDAAGKDIEPVLAKKAVQYALNHSGPDLTVTFSGGEPLLQFDLIEKCIYYMKRKGVERKKKIRFSMITNGSLIDDRILDVLNDHRFDVQFSFDVHLREGPMDRERFRSGEKVLQKLIEAENISLSTNTVFTPENAGKIVESVDYLNKNGVNNIGIGIDQTSDWDESSLKIFREQLKKTKDLVVAEYRRTGKIMVDYFDLKESSGINTCGAAGDQLTVTPDGGLWGCAAFYYLDWENIREHRDDYCYGHVNDLGNGTFEKKTEEIRSNYREFRTDHFLTDRIKCFLCDHLLECRICPAQKYRYIRDKRSLFHIPGQVCQMNRMIYDMNREFRKDIRNLSNI